MDDYLADDERIGRLICVAIDPAGKPLTSVPNKSRVCTSPRRLWKAGIITQCTIVRGRKVYFVHKGDFADWETAHEVLERNDRKGIENPHFSDYLDIIKLEKLGLVKYLDEEEWPGYSSQEMGTTRHTEGACAIC